MNEANGESRPVPAESRQKRHPLTEAERKTLVHLLGKIAAQAAEAGDAASRNGKPAHT